MRSTVPNAGLLRRIWFLETRRGAALSTEDRRTSVVLSIAVVAVIVLVAFAQGASSYVANLAQASFYQYLFAPALNLACTGRLEAFEPTSAARAFLYLERFDLPDCEAVSGSPAIAWDATQHSIVYLQVLAAVAWRVLGIEWRNVFPVAGLLTAAFAVANYGLFRVFMPSRIIGAIGSILIVSSWPAVELIPHLRDYSKAAFIVGSTAFLAAAIAHPGRLKSAFLKGLGAGALVGLGLGFRPDVTIVLPIAVLAPLILLGGAPWRSSAKSMLAIWIGFAVGYMALLTLLALIAPPAGAGPSLISHVFVLGFADNFFSGLGMRDADYSVFSPYTDEYVHGIVNLFSGAGSDSPIGWATARYAEVSAQLLAAIVKTTPNDVLLRAFYAANRVGELPAFHLVWGPQLLAVVPLLLLTRPRQVLTLVVALAILIAAMTLQFDMRHMFYLTAFGLALTFLSIEAAISVIVGWWRSGRLAIGDVRRFGIVLGVLLSIGAGVSFLSIVTAHWQSQTLSRTLDAYGGLQWAPIDFLPTPTGIVPIGSFGSEGSDRLYFEGDVWRGQNRALGDGLSVFSKLTFRVNAHSGAGVLQSVSGWRSVQGDSVVLGDKGFTISSTRSGYAVQSVAMDANALFPNDSSERNKRVTLRASGEVLSGRFTIGVLTAAEDKFVLSDQLPEGRWAIERTFELTPDLSTFTVMFSNARAGGARLRVDSIDLVDPDGGSCDASEVWIKPKYHYHGTTLASQGIGAILSPGKGDYYFPVIYASKSYYLDGLDLSGLDARCVESWSVAREFPPGLVPVEMITVNSALESDHRGEWADIWQELLY